MGENYKDYDRELYLKASLLMEDRQEEQATKILEQLLTKLSENNPEEAFLKSEILVTKGFYTANLKTIQEGMEYIQKAAKILQSVDGGSKSQQMALIQNALGEFHYRMGKIQEAAEHLEQSSKILDYLIEEETDEDNKRMLYMKQAYCYEYLGNFHSDLRNFDEAKQFLESSLNIWKQLSGGGRPVDAEHIKVINSLGVLYATYGQFDKGIEYLQQSKALLEPLEQRYPELYAWTLLCLARYYHMQFDYKGSQKFVLQAETISRKYNAPLPYMSQILEHKSNILNCLGQYQESLNCTVEALKAMEERGSTKDSLYCRLLYA